MSLQVTQEDPNMVDISVNQDGLKSEAVEGYDLRNHAGRRTSVSTTASDIPEEEKFHPDATVKEGEGYDLRKRRRSSVSTTASDIPTVKIFRPSATTSYFLTEEEKEALPKGVYFHVTNQEWRASIQKGEGRSQKTFSVHKYGFEGARLMALEAAGYMFPEAPPVVHMATLQVPKPAAKRRKTKSQSDESYTPRQSRKHPRQAPTANRPQKRRRTEQQNVHEVVERGRSEVVERGRSEVVERGRSEVVQRGRSEVVQRGRSEVVQRGRSEVVQRSREEDLAREILALLNIDDLRTLAAMAVHLSLSNNYNVLSYGVQCAFVRVCQELIDEYEERYNL